MTYKVTGFNNFMRVFEVPEKFSTEYCFGGGIPTNFQMVDWFHPVSGLPQWAVSEQKYNELIEKGELQKSENHETIIDTVTLEAELTAFINKKNYTREGRQYLCICNFGYAFMFTCVKTIILQD